MTAPGGAGGPSGPGGPSGGDLAIVFRDGRVDDGAGGELAEAMRAEVAHMYDGLDLDAPHMPRAGHAELSPPHGAFLIGYRAGRPICCGGIKRLPDGTCEIKRMFVVVDERGRGVGRLLLSALERRARELGYAVARLDTGARQHGAMHLYESAGYRPIGNFNGNPAASYHGEKRLA
jgi:GNAT superfamily N-acetyltransferase